MRVGDILTRNANKFPKKTALVSDAFSEDYGTLNLRVNRLANDLLSKGLTKGDRVGVLAHNGHQFVEIYFAVAKTGGIFCPYNNHLKQSELKEIIDYSTPRFLFFDIDYESLVRSLQPELGSVDHYICIQNSQWPAAGSYEESLSRGEAKEPGVHLQDDDVMSMFFTAGTTGKPKGALHTHRHLIMNAITGVIELKIDYDDRILITIPMYHVAGEDHIVRHAYMPNTIFMRREGGFNAAEVLDFIDKNRITQCQMVPTMIHTLLQLPDLKRFDLSSLRALIYTGAPMPVEMLKTALQMFRLSFVQLYGQTEAGPLMTMLKPEDHILDGSEKRLARLASSGKAVIDVEIRIVDESGNDVKIGEVGEIIARSEAMMKAYWQMPEETEKKLKGGWLYTGDLGKFDEDKYVYIVERKNDMIISGGVNIYPREIEEVLYRHQAVLEATVVGVPDEHWGEAAKAFIVLKGGVAASGSEIMQFCGEHLAGYKKPKSVEFWKELPKSPQGKILKRVIKESFKKP
jgi:acyl-CoA synthetase (AMP-forming)/AMP-acid ligase II